MQSGLQVVTHGGGIGQQVLFFHGVDGGDPRPHGQRVAAKGAAVVAWRKDGGGFGANHQLRQPLMCLNVYLMQQPEAYLGGLGEQMDENGVVTSEGLNEFLQKFAVSFVRWTGRFTGTK